jgi:hypothetical protein
LFLVFRSHFELNVDVAVASVENGTLAGLVETYCDGTKVKVVRLNLKCSITSTTQNLKRVLFVGCWDFSLSHGLLLAASWVIESNAVFKIIIDIPGVNWHTQVIIFLLKSRKSSINLRFFIWLQESLTRSKLDLILVLFWHLPLILKRDSRLVLDEDGLFAADSDIGGWEK